MAITSPTRCPARAHNSELENVERVLGDGRSLAAVEDAGADLDAIGAAARESGLEVERVWGRGSQYCQVLLRRAAQAASGTEPAKSRPAPGR